MVLAVPALAADQKYNDDYDSPINVDDGIDNIAIINQVVFEPSKIDSLISSNNIETDATLDVQNEQSEKAIHYEAVFDKGIVEVYTDVKNVTKTNIEDYVNMANNAIKQEIAIVQAKNEAIPDIIVYQFTDGDIQIACDADINKTRSHATVDDFFVKEIDIFENISIDSGVDNDVNMVGSMAATNVPDGFDSAMGIRQMAYGDGQYMTAIVTNCPPLNVDKTVNGIPNKNYSYYHYIGFEGQYNNQEFKSDMGVMYSPGINGWLPYMKVNQLGKEYMIYSDKEGVINVGCVINKLNGSAYGMSSPITITGYKYVNGYDPNTGQNNGSLTVRCTIKGTRISPKTENIMCISEAGIGANVSTEWRVLTTVTGAGKDGFPAASNASAPRIEMNYSNVKIGTQLAKWNTSSANNALVRARITKNSTAGSIQGKVNFD